MKQLRFSTLFSVPILRLALCALLITSANQRVKARASNSSNPSGAIFATSAADGGRLVVRRSPVLGHNVRITLTIDGQLAGTLVRGHTFDRYITPGRHILTASPSRSGDAWKGTLDMRPGKAYSYTASFNVNKLVLTPVSGSP
jgi:hypothetical protein